MSDPTFGLSAEVDHFVEQWFGEPRQEVQAMIYRWLGIAWDDARSIHSPHPDAVLPPCACWNPYTITPTALSDWPAEQMEALAAACARAAKVPSGLPSHRHTRCYNWFDREGGGFGLCSLKVRHDGPCQ